MIIVTKSGSATLQDLNSGKIKNIINLDHATFKFRCLKIEY